MSEGDRRGGRQREGRLYYVKSGWRAQLTVTLDGVSVRKSFDLETHDRAAAKVKVRRLLQQSLPTSEQAAAPITIGDFGEQWLARREAQKIAAVGYERRYFERIWRPKLGALPFARVSVADVQEVLDAAIAGKIMPEQRLGQKAKPKPYGRQSVVHIRATLVGLFKAAERNELVNRNVAALSEVPAEREDGFHKARAVLTDAEIAAFLSHPKVDAELKVLVLLSRTIGGLRAGDLNALDWTQFSPGFETCSFVRRKTKKKRPTQEVHAVPDAVRPFVAEWHARLGSPEFGPVFPVRKGKRAGQSKVANNSYADPLRRELLKAGIDRHELHHETPTTLPVDFHSTRRAYAQAINASGTNVQTAMQLTGHSDPKVHQRYADAHDVRVLPAAAVPAINLAAAATLRKLPKKAKGKPDAFSFGAVRLLAAESAFFPERDIGFEPTTSSLGSSCSTN